MRNVISRAERALGAVASIVLAIGLAVAGPASTAAADPSGGSPLPWERTYVPEIAQTGAEWFTELMAACAQDLDRGVRDNGVTGAPTIAVVGDSISSQTRDPALSDDAFHWAYASHCGEQLASAIDTGRLADAHALHPDVLVIALGTNDLRGDGTFRPETLAPVIANLHRALDATDDVPCRVLVNVARNPLPMPADQAVLRDAQIDALNREMTAAQARAGVHVDDWAGRLVGHEAAWSADGIHLTRAGINARINSMVATARQCRPPDAPSHLGAVGGSGMATVWWDPLPDPEQVTSYQVELSDGRTMVTTQPVLNVPDLRNGSPYRFRVTARNAAGSSPPSPWTAAATPTSRGARFTPTTPTRVLDSRVGTGGLDHALAAGETFLLDLSSVLPANASSVVLNLTATDQTATTFLTVWPGDESRPLTSNLNPRPGVAAVPAMVTSRVGADGSVRLYNNSGTVHVIADVVGSYGPAGDTTGSLFAPLPPSRVLDTRYGIGGVSGALGAHRALTLTIPGVPPDATAAVVNVTSTDTTADGFVTLYPAGAAVPLASSLNPQRGLDRANLTSVRLGPNATISVFNNSATTDLVIDLVGYFTAPGAVRGGSEYFPMTPERHIDSRDGTGGITGPIGNVAGLAVPMAGQGAVPSDATAVDVNVTVVNPSAKGFTTVWPGGTQPTASTLNFERGETIANRDLAGLASGGLRLWSAASSVQYVVDASGWFGPVLTAPVVDPVAPGYAAFPLTSGDTDTYRLDATANGVSMGARSTNRDAATRVAFVPTATALATDEQSCATWSSATGDFHQEGATLRELDQPGRTRAITVTKNVYAGIYSTFNVHVWDSASPDIATLIASFDLHAAFSRNGQLEPFPWRLCARAVGDVVAFEAWPLDQPEPAWGDPTHGGAVELPPGWVYPGRAGWYAGHLVPGANVVYTDLAASTPPATAANLEASRPLEGHAYLP
jgi:hypothetical protein